MLFRSLSCLGWPCNDFIFHAVVSGVREQPGGGTQCPRIPVATALDTLSFALATERNPSVSQGSTEFQAWTAPSHHHRAHLVRSLALPLASEPGLWILPPPGIYLHYPDSTSGRRPETMLDRLPPPRPLAPLPPHSGREPGQASPTTPGASSFRPSPTVVSTRIHHCPSQCTS